MSSRLAVLRAALWSAALLVGLFVPGRFVAGIHGDVQRAGHVVLFAVSAWLWLAAFPRRRWAVVAAGVALAVGSEVLQAWLAVDRGAEVRDAAADLLGLALGFGLWAARGRPAPEAR